MPSARASRRGAFLNCRLAVYGIQKADCSSPAMISARLFMALSLLQAPLAASAECPRPRRPRLSGVVPPARVSGLHALAVDVEPHVEVLRVANLVAGDQPWPDRARAVEALALVPLAGRHLESALRDVVHHAVAGDVVERGCFLDIPGLGADDHAELDFPVELG